MAQPSVAQYFITRKRPAANDYKSQPPAKLLKSGENVNKIIDKNANVDNSIKVNLAFENYSDTLKQNVTRRIVQPHKPKKPKEIAGPSIQDFLQNMKSKSVERSTTPPQSEKTETTNNDELLHLKRKMSRSAKLQDLKASLQRFKDLQGRLKVAERKSELTSKSKVENLKTLEFEITVSPQKIQSPEKPYLSPRKESGARRHLLASLSPVKRTLYEADDDVKDLLDLKSGLRLPYKYRTFSEIFRAVDVVAQIMYNRKEMITFKKMKPAVEEMLKRTFSEKHLSQICGIYPTAYKFSQEKLRDFGTGTRNEHWNLILNPNIENGGEMTSQVLLNRRRNLQDKLINLTKTYHNEFLLSLTPPITVNSDKILHWHPEFDLEKVPEIEQAKLPQKPHEETLTSGKQVLEKAREMFGCNTRVEKALTRLKEFQEKSSTTEEQPVLPETSLLKGIPKSLLEKVRQRQAAKALLTMTRSVDKEKEVQIYSRLPEIARLMRSLFVTEKKSVLQMDTVIEKLRNSYRCFLNKTEVENHLRIISNEIPEWLIFHNVRGLIFLKLSKNADLSTVIKKLESRLKEISESN